MLNKDQVEVIKRVDKSKSFLYSLGLDEKDLFERVIIDRKEHTVCHDRIDSNFWINEPFLGRRDFFYEEEQQEGSKPKLAFVRHHFWLNKLLKFPAQSFSNYSAWSYKRAFKREQE